MNVVHDYAKFLEPGFTGVDYVMPVAVNINQTCNAYWDGNGVNFYAAGGGCPNTATMPDVVFHEYGHGINDKLYIQYGSPSGMNNGALHEGLADVDVARPFRPFREVSDELVHQRHEGGADRQVVRFEAGASEFAAPSYLSD